jgi:hypothetical protein
LRGERAADHDVGRNGRRDPFLIWLASYLNPEVIKDHDALEEVDGSRDQGVIDKVLQGEKHPWEGPTGSYGEGRGGGIRAKG